MKDPHTSTEYGQRAPWSSVAEIPGFPFDTFEEMQVAVSYRSFSVGIDPLAAAAWADGAATGASRMIVAALSILLIAAAAAAVVVALWWGNYWLLLAPLIQAVAFYISHPASRLRKLATIVGAVSVYAVLDLLIRRMPTAAMLVAYGGLTFASVRIAGYLNNSAFRKALLSDEQLFLIAYANLACTLRNKETGKVYDNASR